MVKSPVRRVKRPRAVQARRRIHREPVVSEPPVDFVDALASAGWSRCEAARVPHLPASRLAGCALRAKCSPPSGRPAAP